MDGELQLAGVAGADGGEGGTSTWSDSGTRRFEDYRDTYRSDWERRYGPLHLGQARHALSEETRVAADGPDLPDQVSYRALRFGAPSTVRHPRTPVILVRLQADGHCGVRCGG